MEVKLIVTGGKQAGQEVPVPGRKFFIGRAEDCQLRPHSDLISRHHCVILVEDGFVAIRDFGSENGTYVNGQRVSAEVELKSGDHLKVGQLEFEIRMDIGVGGKKLPKVHSVQEAAVRTAEGARPQPQKSGRDEMDVSTWLDDAELAAPGDTATMDPTQTIGVGKTPPQGAKSQTASEEDAEEPMEEKGTAAPAGKKDDSRDAASQSLKSLFRRF